MKYILIGQKNVGKSSIFNKIIGKKLNIVDPTLGSTRDWIEYQSIYKNKIINLIDTPGINTSSNDSNDKKITLLIKNNIKKDYIILFVVNVKIKSINIDYDISRFLRKFGNEILLIINKVDNNKLEDEVIKFDKLGLTNQFFTSCSHNIGLKNLKLFLHEKSKIYKPEDSNIKNENITIGVYGKPNVGKSTFINNFIGFERFQTGNKPGITTDAVSHQMTIENKIINIYDTAGIRQQNKILDGLVTKSTNLSIKNISKTKINLLIIDCVTGLDRQDKRLINMIINKGIFLIIIFNKIDLVKDQKKLKTDLIEQIYNEIKEAKNLKYFFISSLKKNNVTKVFDFVLKNINLDTNISTSKINSWLKNVTSNLSHPYISGKKINFKYAVQKNKLPIKIMIFTNYPKLISESYKRYLMNNFIKKFQIKNQKIKILFKKSSNPYSK